ncbi:MAG: TIGR03790 family protein [Cyanobacteriota bacterium]|nr:TIGR03790 family protein [Cyanobacteriota bacterium]
MAPPPQSPSRPLPLLPAAVGATLLTLMVVARLDLPGLSVGEAETAASPLEARHLALVINSADPLSEAIGARYIQARGLKPAQVIRVRFTPGRPALTAAEFQALHQQVKRQTPPQIQAYARAWSAPWRVECVSITSAFAFGQVRSTCGDTCRLTPLNPYFARGEVRRPWSALGMRPTMLLAATTPEAGRALIERGVAADGTAPPGTAYLLSTSDTVRNRRAAGYGTLLRNLAPGFQVRALQGDSLRGVRDVMAYFTGLVAVPDLATNRFRPGAVGDHLTSFGGALTGPSGRSIDGGNGQMSALRWLEAGASGSYGTVVEPCNHPGKFPDPGLVLSYYRRGDTLIESYWRSVAMPDQGVFIGEPLARPWGPRGAGVRAGGSKSVGATPSVP